MAIKKIEQSMQYTLQEEIASRVINIQREVLLSDSDNGVVTQFTAFIHPKSITYELDSNKKKVGIYETKELPGFSLTNDELLMLFAIPVTLKDGTTSRFGDILANFADQMIAQHVGTTETDIITTPNINIPAVI